MTEDPYRSPEVFPTAEPESAPAHHPMTFRSLLLGIVLVGGLIAAIVVAFLVNRGMGPVWGMLSSLGTAAVTTAVAVRLYGRRRR